MLDFSVHLRPNFSLFTQLQKSVVSCRFQNVYINIDRLECENSERDQVLVAGSRSPPCTIARTYLPHVYVPPPPNARGQSNCKYQPL